VADALSRYDQIFKEAGESWNVDPLLLKSIARQESGGNPNATSSANAQGVMQIIPSTQRYLGVTDPRDPVQSIYGAAKYMNEALEKEGRPDLALLYYHGGPGWRGAYGPESQGYVPAVTSHYVKYSRSAPVAAPVSSTAAPTPEPGNPMAKKEDKVESDDDFLARTASKGVIESDDDFLKRTGAAPGDTKETATVAAPPSTTPNDISGEGRDEYGRPTGPLAPLPPAETAVPKAFSSIAEMRNALQPEPGWVASGVLPMATKEVSPGQGDINAGVKWDWGPVRSLANPLLDLMEGTGLSDQGGASPLAGKVSPDATMLLAGTMTGNPLSQFRNPLSAAGRDIRFGPSEPRPPSAGDMRAAPLPPDFVANPLTPEGRVAAVVEGGEPAVPASPTGIPVTPPKPLPSEPTPGAPVLSAADHQWAGGMRQRLSELAEENKEAGIPGDLSAAATPEQLATLTPAQMKAYRAQAELRDILAPPEPGLDRSIYVHGSEPTLAEYSGNPATSQKERLYRQRAPDQYDARRSQNNQARVTAYEDLEGTQPQLQDIRDSKAAAAEKDGAAFMAKARPLDFSPALEWIDGKLADSRIKESPSRVKVLTDLRASLFDESGALKTDPGAGWGMHDHMIDALDKAGDRTSAERYATKLLTEYKKIVDGVNNTASDGAFQTFLDNQTNFARQINSMEELQKFRPRFTNNKGDINAAAFHKFVADLAARRGRPGVDAAMSISDDTMHGLINIDKDLKRATNIDLGKARGSETNLFFTLAQATGLGAAHAGAAALSGGNPTASLLLQGAINQGHRITGNALLNRAVKKGLAPPPGGYDYNPLTPPSAP